MGRQTQMGKKIPTATQDCREAADQINAEKITGNTNAEPGWSKTPPVINEPSQPHEQAPSRESQGCNEAGSLLGAEVASFDFCSSA